MSERGSMTIESTLPVDIDVWAFSDSFFFSLRLVLSDRMTGYEHVVKCLVQQLVIANRVTGFWLSLLRRIMYGHDMIHLTLFYDVLLTCMCSKTRSWENVNGS